MENELGWRGDYARIEIVRGCKFAVADWEDGVPMADDFPVDTSVAAGGEEEAPCRRDTGAAVCAVFLEMKILKKIFSLVFLMALIILFMTEINIYYMPGQM